MRIGLLISFLVHGAAAAGLALLAAPPPEHDTGVPLAVAIRAVEIAPVERPPESPRPRAEPVADERWELPAEEPPLEFEPLAEPPRLDARVQPSRAVRLPRSLRPSAPPPPAPVPPAVPAPLPARPAPARAGEVHPPRLLADLSPRARYPARARRIGLEGTVTLLLRIGVDGAVERVDVAVSSGHAELDHAAAEAAAAWRFEPARRDGRAVAYEVRAPVEFRLADP